MTAMTEPVRTYRDFVAGRSITARARDAARDAAVTALSVGRSPRRTSGWIRFPYYHHVFDDEREGFARQLDCMAGIGEFINLDDAVTLLDSGDAFDGRYFCVTFDDGFKNWATNAMPILLDRNAPAAFFLVTGMIGASIERDRERMLGFYDSGRLLVEFLDWDDCRRMADAGMTIGSHTRSHVHLKDLDTAAAEAELRRSKEDIERALGRACDHFCCPFGREGIDFDPGRDPALAKRVGFRSFLTGHRGANRRGASPLTIRRDHLLANWGNAQLRYFFSS